MCISCLHDSCVCLVGMLNSFFLSIRLEIWKILEVSLEICYFQSAIFWSKRELCSLNLKSDGGEN